MAYDKSIYSQDDGTYLLVIREDGDSINIPRQTLEQAQETADMLPSDGGHYDRGLQMLEFNPQRKVSNEA